MKQSKQGASDSARLSGSVGTDPAEVMNNRSGVMNNPPRARTRVDGLRPSGSQSGKSILPSCSQSTGACARTRAGLPPIRDREAYFRAWRTATFGGDFDPVRVAVDEAVAAFSCGKLPAGRDWDRREWLKIANRVGVENFRDAFRGRCWGALMSSRTSGSVCETPPPRSRSCSTSASRCRRREELREAAQQAGNSQSL